MSENILPITVASSKRINKGNDLHHQTRKDSIPRIKSKSSTAGTGTGRDSSEVSSPPLELQVQSEFNDGDIEIEEDEYRRDRQGWIMVALVFLTNFLVLGFFKSLGILTKILNKEFVEETMEIYVVMCITYSLNCVAGPLACYLTRVYTPKMIAIVGTSLVSFGLIISYFAKSLTFLYLSIGVFCGLGSGFTYPTGVILVGGYFAGTRHAAIANAVVVSGSPIGGMIMPMVISWLSELYTSRGTFIIVGVLMFSAIICARSFKSASSFDWREDDLTVGGGDQSVEIGVEGRVIDGETRSLTERGKPEVEEITPVDKNENVLEIREEKFSLMNLSSTSGVFKIFERDDEAEIMATDASLESFCEAGGHHHPDTPSPDQPLPLPFPIATKIGSRTKSVFLSGTGKTIHDTGAGGGPGTGSGPGPSPGGNIYLNPFGTGDLREKGRMVVGSFPGLESLKKENLNNNNLGVFSDNEMVCHYLNNENDNVIVAAATTEAAKTPEVDASLRVRKSIQLGRAPPLQTSSHPYVLALDHSCVILCSNSDLKPPQSHHHHHHPVRHEHKTNPNHNPNGSGGGDGGEGDSVSTSPSSEGSEKETWKEWFLTSPLSNKTYLLLLISNITTAISTTNIHLMIAQLVEEDEEDDYTKSSMLYLIMAFADLSGRLCGAILTARNILTPSVIYGVGLITAGISSSFFAMYSTFVKLCLGALAFGVSSGLHIGIFGLLLTSAVGFEKIHVGYGVAMFTTGTLQCISILLSGRTISREKNSFTWLAPLLGTILTCGGALWMCALIFCRAGPAAYKRNRSRSRSRSLSITRRLNQDECECNRGDGDNCHS